MLYKLLDFIFPYRKFREKNLTLIQKLSIYFEILFNIAFVLFVASYLLLPHLSKTVIYNNIHLHMIGDTNKTFVKDYMVKADTYLHSNPLYTNEENIDIFILNNSILYAIMAPMEIFNLYASYATTWGQNIVFKYVDLKKNKSYYGEKKENFDAVLAHELIHTYQNSKYGFFVRYKSSWIIEGYATYASKGLYIKKPKEILENYIKHYPEYENMPSKHLSKKYQVWMLMVKHAIEKMHKSVDDLHLGKVEYDEVLDSLLKEYNITK